MVDEIEKIHNEISVYNFSCIFSNEKRIFPPNFTISAVNDWSSYYQRWIHSGPS